MKMARERSFRTIANDGLTAPRLSAALEARFVAFVRPNPGGAQLFDRGNAGGLWVETFLAPRLRCVVRWKKGRRLIDPWGDERKARESARDKRHRDHRWLRDSHTGAERKVGVVALPANHPAHAQPRWLVGARPGKGRDHWYLTSEVIGTVRMPGRWCWLMPGADTSSKPGPGTQVNCQWEARAYYSNQTSRDDRTTKTRSPQSHASESHVFAPVAPVRVMFRHRGKPPRSRIGGEMLSQASHDAAPRTRKHHGRHTSECAPLSDIRNLVGVLR